MLSGSCYSQQVNKNHLIFLNCLWIASGVGLLGERIESKLWSAVAQWLQHHTLSVENPDSNNLLNVKPFAMHVLSLFVAVVNLAVLMNTWLWLAGG